MDAPYVYQKKRSEFGRQCLFSDKGPDLIDSYPSNKRLLKHYILRNPVHRSTQCAPIQASHTINTERAEYANTAMNHIEGGWPKDINTTDEEQIKRYRRKVEKDEGYHHTMMQLLKTMENCILQNNAINIYQQYFYDVEPTPLVERSTARTVNVYKDQSTPTRPITHISWSPDSHSKLAISHCNLQFQANVPNQTTHSYIWDVGNPNIPINVLRHECSMVCLEYNPKDCNILAAGLLNGQIGVFDTRKGNEPVQLSLLEYSFRDPVRNVLWINTKSGTEFFSSSTDGQVKWWDIRKLSEPTEVLILDATSKEEDQTMANALCASCLEYESTIPTRFMVGSEQGIVVSCNRKGKTPAEKMGFRFQAHLGPVLACQRNYGFVKNFLTIGDWTAKIWSEDCRESPIIWTSFHKARLTDGAWSPTRISVFFVIRSDGWLDAWDILNQQKHACLGVKVCDEKLTCLRTHEAGRIVAVGNEVGTTYLTEFSENLALSNKNDKLLLTSMFERETRREKILEARQREIRLRQKAAITKSSTAAIGKREHVDIKELFDSDNVIQCENEFKEKIEQELEAAKGLLEEEKGKDLEELLEEKEDGGKLSIVTAAEEVPLVEPDTSVQSKPEPAKDVAGEGVVKQADRTRKRPPPAKGAVDEGVTKKRPPPAKGAVDEGVVKQADPILKQPPPAKDVVDEDVKQADRTPKRPPSPSKGDEDEDEHEHEHAHEDEDEDEGGFKGVVVTEQRTTVVFEPAKGENVVTVKKGGQTVVIDGNEDPISELTTSREGVKYKTVKGEVKHV